MLVTRFSAKSKKAYLYILFAPYATCVLDKGSYVYSGRRLLSLFGPNHMWAQRALRVQTPSYVKFMNKSKYCIALIGQAEAPKCTLHADNLYIDNEDIDDIDDSKSNKKTIVIG